MVLSLDETSVLVGENGCGKSSLLNALEICLGHSAPAGGFHFRPGDFHRGPEIAEVEPVRIRLEFREQAEAPDLTRWSKLRSAGLAPPKGVLDFSLTVQAELRDGGITTSYFFEAANFRAEPQVTLAEVRRLLPFIRIHGGSPAQPEVDLQQGRGVEDLARERVQRQLRADLASLVEVDAVSEATLSSVRDSVDAELRRLEVASWRAPVLDPDSRVQAPMSPSGSWAQMAELLRGSGARSLAMLAFAGAFLQARGDDVLDPDARPIVSVEDPETALHPIMLNSVWNLIRRLPTQKIVTTNSSDLLAAIPLSSLRRMVRDATGRARVFNVPEDGMGPDDLRRVAYHLRVRRGTALFMRFWLLVEGETEFWLLPEIARILGFDLRAEGVECLEFAQSGVAPLARLANHLGIGWHMMSDGDRAGESYGRQAEALVHKGRSQITVLRERDIEHCLWEHGYHSVYMRMADLSAGAKPRRGRVAEVIRRAIKGTSKPQLALVLGEAMRAPGSPGVPPQLEVIIRDAVYWAAHGRFPEPGPNLI